VLLHVVLAASAWLAAVVTHNRALVCGYTLRTDHHHHNNQTPRSVPILPRIIVLTEQNTSTIHFHMSAESNTSRAEAPLAPTAVSCPAKVLVAGGYLVLDRNYTGLVFGLDARIHCIVEPIKSTSGVSISEIVVKSPQFRDAIWEYGYRTKEHDSGVTVHTLSV
jgi:hypothetical protein